MKYTLSSLLSKLTEVEKNIIALYEDRLGKVSDPTLKIFLNKALEDAKKRLDDIEWIKGFIVVEMTLEPMIGPDLLEYVEKMREFIEHDNYKEVEKARIEAYKKAIEMVENISPEAADLLRNFIRRSEDLLSILG